jgi:FlaA1/EpsC-like NDP-sugar epimerase
MVYGDSMDAARIVGYFKGKSILVTGSTGFLGKSMHIHAISSCLLLLAQ